MKSVVHVGAVIDSRTPATWVNNLLRCIETHELMQLHVFISDSSAAAPASSVAQQGPPGAGDRLINSIIDKPHFKHDPWAAQPLPDSQNVLNPSEQPSAVENCDVILLLTTQTLPQQLLIAHANVWSAGLDTLDGRIRQCLINRAPFVWIHLWRLQAATTEKAASCERVASHSLPCQTYSISDLRRLSYSALPNIILSRLIWLANHPERKLDPIEKQTTDQGVFNTERQQAEIDAFDAVNGVDTSSSAFKTTSLTRAIVLLMRQSYERVHHKLFSEHWRLAIVCSPTGQTQSLQDISQIPVHAFASIAEPADVMWADPHLYDHDGQTYVFFENMHAPNENAQIDYARLDKSGRLIESGTALTAEHHLSFPFVFSHEGHQYMIPETASLSSVSLYKAKRFPDQWEHHSQLLSDINAADSVIFRHDNCWWMFTNCQSHRSVDERDELLVFHADKLEGPWQPHALNPVLTGVDRSRMAGPVIEENGRLYRPSQYGAYRYGYGVNMSCIEELTPTTYRESAKWRMIPRKGKGWSGCHSFAHLGNLTIIDRVRFSRR